MRKIRYIKIVLKTGIEACFDYKKHSVRASEGLVSVYKESTEEKVFVTPIENILYADLNYFKECHEVKENDEAVR
jgi:hypothetical protein